MYQELGKNYRKKYPVWEWLELLENFYLRKLIDKYKPLRIVDAGCGPCNHLYLLKNSTNLILIGFDYSREGLKVCKNYTNLIMRASITDIPLKDSSFDMVYAIQVIEVLPEWEYIEKSFSECARILKPGGIFITVDYRLGGFLKKKFEPARGKFGTLPRWAFDKEDYIKLAQKSGLSVVKIGTIFNFKPRLVGRFPMIKHLWLNLDYIVFKMGILKGLYLFGVFKK